jgi:hypothetical protein
MAGGLAAAVAERGLPADLWGLRPGEFGVPAARITTVLDVRKFLAPKLLALRSHRTQLPPEHLFQVIPVDLAEEFLGREYFVRVWPPEADLGDDWLVCQTRSPQRG